ncbi:MAG TPA: hypothetical protein DCQ09_00800 [Alcanivorax sp.]|nr:hypothetical protein [Alcanivorax sp.]
MSEIDWSKAPEGATHFDPNDDVGLPWMRLQQGRWRAFDEEYQCWTAPMDEDDSFIRNNDGAQCIPRPSQWRGPEDGLPPVGTVCEARHHGGWAECEIIAHVRAPENRIEAVYQAADDWDWLSSPSNFRPIKSDKERAVEAALAQDCDPRDGMLSRHDFCARLYDAGLLRLPEERS